VQSASHFALRLAPRIDLIAVDRQLTDIDPRQREFMEAARAGGAATLAVLSDPVHLFGDASRTGTAMVKALHLDTTARETFVLSGDIHHYERAARAESLHVIAGGGGAFLHPARVAAGGLTPAVTWPGVAQSRHLLRGVAWKLACGRSGFLPHAVLLLIFLPAVLFRGRLYARTGIAVTATLTTTIVVGAVFALLGGGARRKAVLPFALAAAAVTALIPIGASSLVRAALADLWRPAFAVAVPCLTLALAVFAGTLVFGGFLALMTLLGYEHMQALTALDHPGFKHFVRLRVRADGSGVDGWCIGATDPLRPGQSPELVDHFVWRPFGSGAAATESDRPR
jgi:hypothetical protein